VGGGNLGQCKEQERSDGADEGSQAIADGGGDRDQEQRKSVAGDNGAQPGGSIHLANSSRDGPGAQVRYDTELQFPLPKTT